MIYPSSFERKLGFDQIRTQLKGRCTSSLGTEWVERELAFMADWGAVCESLQVSAEFIRFCEEDTTDLVPEFYDVRTPLLRLRPERTWMEETDLFALKRSLTTVIAYAKAFRQLKEGSEEEADADNVALQVSTDDPLAAPEATMAEEETACGLENSLVAESLSVDYSIYLYPALARMAEGVAVFPMIVERIDRVLNQYGKVRDDASPELSRLRGEIDHLTRSLSRTLRTVITEAQNDGYIDREVTPALRDGRLVIPVPPAAKRKIKGIVHDESATGRTVFIEPSVVVESNNRIREMRAAEHREVIRILSELSALIRPHISDIMGSMRFLGHVDYLCALQVWSRLIEARVILPVASPRLDWQKAYHPLLAARLKAKGEAMTPLDISLLASKGRILLISGPNAGGKSVCLKTVGLLQYMLQCGMPVPASASSQPGCFDDVMLDMGDDQSIDNDLSTYSSHLLHMKQMMKTAGRRTLLLIDEFGSGTEPRIGGALAEAILHQLEKMGAWGVITTHYQNLKHYASAHPSVVNGAMLYDRQLMLPLFRLQVGLPGSSFAIEIARKAGIPAEVIDYASNLVGNDYVMSDKYVQDIIRDKLYWETKRQEVKQRERKLREEAARYAEQSEELKRSRHEVLAKARDEARDIVATSNALIENTIRTIRETQAEKERTRQVRNEIASFAAGLDEAALEADAKLNREMERLKRRQERKKNRKAHSSSAASSHPGPAAEPSRPRMGEGIEVGGYVLLDGSGVPGQVQALQGSRAHVLFGMMQSTVPLARLLPTAPPRPEKKDATVAATFVSEATRAAMREKQLHFRSEIDLRGQRVDEALTSLSRFIDDAIQCGGSPLRILHGTGTGALRIAIRAWLDTMPAVKSFHDEDVRFGGAGITVVEMA